MLFRLVAAASIALLGAVISAEDFSAVANNNGESTVGQVVAAGGDAQAQAPTNHIQHQIRSGSVQVRGVNLGSWLVAEKWMTAQADMWDKVDDTAFAGGGEFQVMKHGQDESTRRARFSNHQNTFVMEKDIEAIAAAGLNTVRVPIGYWIVGEDLFDTGNLQEWKTYPNGTVNYLDRLIKDWAVKHNVAVLVSIHGAKGSQNGADHSSPTDTGKTYWSKFKENVDNTINVAQFLADRYKNDAAFLGIGLLNEPNGDTDENVLNQYYQDAYKAVRATGTDCILTVMPLLFKQDVDNLVGFMEAPAYTNVWVEWHPYFIWGYETKTASELLTTSIAQDFQNKVTTWNNRPNSNKLFFGEWSLANTGQFPDPNSQEFQKWTQAQVSVMDQAKGGWAYWSWRVYGDDADGGFNAWSMRNVMAKDPLGKIVVNNPQQQQR